MKTALITGASTGIGKEIALKFAKNEFKVYLLARTEQKLNEVKKLITSEGGQAEVIVTDLSKTDSINNAIKTIRENESEVNLIANVAGFWHDASSVFADTDFQDFEQKIILDTFNVGITAPALLVHGLLEIMPSGSSVINISGTFENGAKGWLPYYVSKKAIEDFTVGLSEELEDKGIRVNCISPSDTATEAYKKIFPRIH